MFSHFFALFSIRVFFFRLCFRIFSFSGDLMTGTFENVQDLWKKETKTKKAKKHENKQKKAEKSEQNRKQTKTKRKKMKKK